MAEAVVGVLISKLGAALAKEAAAYGASLLCKEVSALKGLFGEIRKAKRELESMNAYLQESEKFKDIDKPTGLFVNNIREISFRIEDVVDEFMYKLENEKHGGFAAKMKKRIKHVKVWRRLAHRLQDINAELEDAANRRNRFVIPGMERNVGNSYQHARSTNQAWYFAREEDLVGIEDNAAKLKGWLVNDLEKNNTKIAAVWGMGGVGKTTLVDHVYKIVKVHFDAAAWVTVSKSYRVEDILKKIAREFGISIDSSNMEIRSIVEVIHSHLEGKRYILVLDDVWEQDVWNNSIMPIFITTNCTSRFVLTSRLSEVASLATSNCAINLEPLGEYHSWKLFCKEAFRNSDDKRCPSELQELAVKFLQKYEGLPIAIACIGRSLCYKPHPKWETVYKDLEAHSANNAMRSVDTILKISLEDLPHELKNCFLHCAIFPEDCILKRRRLIRHWITAGFIKKEENKTLEEVAEGFLNELVNRSLLQVIEKNELGRVKGCRMHDILRHLALEKAEKECFGRVYEADCTSLLPVTRRLSIQSPNMPLPDRCGGTHLRAIHVFMSSIDLDLMRPILASSLFLSILDLQGTEIKVLPNEVFSLFNLRFLGLRYTRIEILPEAIGKLQNLEVLDAAASALRSLPKDVAKLRKLRYLYAFTMHEEESIYQGFCGVNVPRGIKHLIKLHALQSLTASLETLREVAVLAELRTFSVTNVTSEHSLNLCRAIMNMNHLAHLSVNASDDNEVLPMEALRLPDTLYKLELTGQLDKTRAPQIFSSWSHLNNLSILRLSSSKLNEDSFHSLMVLPSLRLLNLTRAYDVKTICFSAKSFPRLQGFQISGAPQLNQVEIEEGALESLVELEISNCPELKHLPHGIEYLTTLEKLYLEDTAEELIENLRQQSESDVCNEEHVTISHIRNVIVRLTEKNIWERIR